MNHETFSIRPRDAMTARMECWQNGRHQATADPEANLGRTLLLDCEGRIRDKALFDLAIDSKMRGCDLVKIKIGDIVSGADIRTRAIVIQQKTGKPVQFALTADVRASLLAWR